MIFEIQTIYDGEEQAVKPVIATLDSWASTPMTQPGTQYGEQQTQEILIGPIIDRKERDSLLEKPDEFQHAPQPGLVMRQCRTSSS